VIKLESNLTIINIQKKKKSKKNKDSKENKEEELKTQILTPEEIKHK
jgi:hypothetical protein